MLLGIATHHPVVVNFQMALPHTADLAFGINAPGRVDGEVCLQYLGARVTYVVVGESGTPDYGVGVLRQSQLESVPGGSGEGRRRFGMPCQERRFRSR